MVRYEYKAKKRDGAVIAGNVAAKNRATALRMLQREDLVVVELRERRGSATPATRWKGTVTGVPWKVLSSILAVVLLAVFWPRRDTEVAKNVRNRSNVHGGAGKQSVAVAERDTNATLTATDDLLSIPYVSDNTYVVSPVTDEHRRVPPATEGGDGTFSGQTEVAQEKEPPPKAFKTGAEQLLAMVIPASPGAPVPPLPALTEAGLSNDLARALDAEIVIGTNDTEETAALKEGVAALKQQYRELRNAEGWNFTEYLEAMRAQGEEDAAILGAAHRELNELWNDRNLSDDEYLLHLNEINAMLRERGLPEYPPAHP